ncbi:nap1-related protein 2 [Phtheirospermum japonicum]|uniref:Nap1-related protein 2 n=1 Tax=Phtheirospermum japonicum TaxID=374723 RepID=A0A830CGK3_9LAMI|nr:nap1-related protein 2 [Phtheirospermum japonicum]
MGADKGKKQKVGEAEEEKNGTEHIDGELVLSIERLQEIQDELEKINEEASEKVLEVEQKYNVVRKPVYDKRNNIIKSIPDFWLTAFMSHPALSELLTEEDQKIFKYLNNLEVEDCKDVKSGYSITFNFKPNPYFEDTKLTKTFAFLEEGTTKITATSIKWKEGMGIPNGSAEEKKGNKRSHVEERTWRVGDHLPSAIHRKQRKFNFGALLGVMVPKILFGARQPCHRILAVEGGKVQLGFFSWFNDSQHNGDIEEIQDEVAEIIKDDLWPNPLTYFNNEADEEEFEMDDDEDKDTDDSEDDDDEYDED